MKLIKDIIEAIVFMTSLAAIFVTLTLIEAALS